MTETEQVKKIKWNENTISVHTQTHAESTIWKCFRSLRLKLLLPLMELYCCYCCIRHALHIRTHIHTCHLLFALFSNLCTKHTFLYCLHLHCVISPKKKIFVSSLSPLLHVHHDFAETGFCIVTIFPKTKKKMFFPKKANKQHDQTNANTNFRILFAVTLLIDKIHYYSLCICKTRERCVVCVERERERKINK